MLKKMQYCSCLVSLLQWTASPVLSSMYVCVYIRTLQLHYRYAYVLYEDAEAAKSLVEKYTEDPPFYLNKVLDVKFYREPVTDVPKGMWGIFGSQ